MPTENVEPQIDWESRADGEPHLLLLDTHYSRDVRLVRRAAGMWALRHGFRCLTDISADPSGLIVRFLPKTGKV
jgi:hypothetical protein